MTYRDIIQLRALVKRATSISRSIETGRFDEPRISLPIGEALRAASVLEAHLSDALLTAEAELLKRPGRPRKE